MTKQQQEEYAKLHKEAGELVSFCAKEKRQQTGEEKTAQEARYARMDVLRAEAENEKKQAAYAFNSGEAERQNASKSKAQLEAEALNGGAELQTSANFDAARPMTDAEKLKYRKAVNKFLCTGEVDNFTISVSGNSILLPTAVAAPESIRRNMNAFRALLAATGYEPIETTGTENMVLPIFDDTGVTGEAITNDGTAVAAVADSLTTGSVTLTAALYSSKQRWFSNTVLLANGFDVLKYITPVMQKSVDKVEENIWTARLLAMTAPTYINGHDTIISYTDLLNWEHTLNVAYRIDAGFILADSTYRSLRGLVDGNNRPIMDLDPVNVFQSRIHNKPLFVSDYMTALGTANGVVGAFMSGDAIKMRQVIPQRITRYVNVPSYPDMTGFQLFENADCQFVPQAVALLKLAAVA